MNTYYVKTFVLNTKKKSNVLTRNIYSPFVNDLGELSP